MKFDFVERWVEAPSVGPGGERVLIISLVESTSPIVK